MSFVRGVIVGGGLMAMVLSDACRASWLLAIGYTVAVVLPWVVIELSVDWFRHR